MEKGGREGEEPTARGRRGGRVEQGGEVEGERKGGGAFCGLLCGLWVDFCGIWWTF